MVTYIDADIESLGHPVAGDTGSVAARETVDVLGSTATLVVDIAC
jgi:hypothetical protein